MSFAARSSCSAVPTMTTVLLAGSGVMVAGFVPGLSCAGSVPRSAPAMLAGVLGFSYYLFRVINFLYMHYLVDIPERSPAFDWLP